MTAMSAIGAQIPFLRRYAYALTGNQKTADSYVAACLETLLIDPAALPEGGSVRVRLYKLFQAIWLSVQDGMTLPVELDENEGVHRNLAQLSEFDRQALLLTALEGFYAGEAAEILGATQDEVERALDRAMQTAAPSLPGDVLIIEDEPLIAMDLSEIVEGLGHHVINVATTRAEAVAAARVCKPSLIIADVSLSDRSSGIEAVADILREESIPIVFVTAFPEKVRAARHLAVSEVVSKPFFPGSIQSAVSRALMFGPPATAVHAH